jgi:hypothetical protein
MRLTRVGTYTFSANSGDVLVARFAVGDATRPERAVWIWDTPENTAAILEVDASLLQPGQLIPYCESLLLWSEGPFEPRSLKLSYASGDRGMESINGWLDQKLTATGNYHISLRAASLSGRGYIAVEMTKAAFYAEYPPEALHVPERFPPLRSRLGALTVQSLFDEIGNGYQSP